MLRRLWFVLAGLWAGVFLANGATKDRGVGGWDVALGLAPLAGRLAACARDAVRRYWLGAPAADPGIPGRVTDLRGLRGGRDKLPESRDEVRHRGRAGRQAGTS